MRKRYVLVVLMLVVLAVTATWAYRRDPVILQPIAFPHKTHIANQMECLSCHTTADRSLAAGIPSVTECMVCHEVVKTDSPEIKKLAAFAARGEEPPWVRVYEFEPEADLFFTHKRHVKAGVACSVCHGDLTGASDMRRQVQWTMGRCINCHRAKDVSVDCLTCHH